MIATTRRAALESGLSDPLAAPSTPWAGQSTGSWTLTSLDLKALLAVDTPGGSRSPRTLPARRPSEGNEDFITPNGDLWYCSTTLLGEGGFGAVYLGMNDHGMLVAIKQLVVEQSKAPELLNEIHILSSFRHHHIVGYLGSAIVRARLYIIMEFVPCGSLAKVLGQFGVFQVPTARHYTRDVLRGLAYLHDHEVLHRDIKPQNILLDQTGLCKLADFGTAALLTNSLPTDPRTIVGTPSYMSPELLRGEVGKPADIWALGVTLLQLVTGRLLIEGTNVMAVMYALGTMTEAPPLPPELPEDARSFLEGCLTLDAPARATVRTLIHHRFLV